MCNFSHNVSIQIPICCYIYTDKITLDNYLPKQSFSTREERGKQIAQLEGQVSRLDDNTYKVKSQSGHGEYALIQTELGWECECDDSRFRGR